MGKPAWRHGHAQHVEYIDVLREPGEPKHPSSPRKRDDSASSSERKRSSPLQQKTESNGMGRPTREGERPVDERLKRREVPQGTLTRREEGASTLQG